MKRGNFILTNGKCILLAVHGRFSEISHVIVHKGSFNQLKNLIQ